MTLYLNKITYNKSIILLLPSLFFLWILFGFSSEVLDSAQYKIFYDYLAIHTTYPGVEIGFSYFMHFCNVLGLSYQQFLMVYSAVGLILIGKFIQKYTNNPLSVILCYLLHPFVFEICQIRNFMASAFFVYGIIFLIENKKNANLKYIFTITIACLFHRSAVVYFLVLFVRLKWKKFVRILLWTMLFEIIIVFVLLKFGGSILSVLSMFSKLTHYISSDSNTRFATKFFFMLYYCALGFVLYSILHCKKFVENSNTAFIQIACKILAISFVFFPLFFISMDFERFTRNMLLIYYILSTNYVIFKIKHRCETSVAELVTIILTIAIIFFLSFLFSYESTVLPAFTNNLILNGQFIYK